MGKRSHYLIYLFVLGLAGVVGDVLGGQAQPAWLAGGLLVVFAASFVVAVELAHRQIAAGTGSAAGPLLHAGPRAVLIGLMAVIAVATTLAYGAQWNVLFVYVATTSAMLVPLRWAPAAIVGVAVVAATAVVAGDWSPTGAATAGTWALVLSMAGSITLLIRRRGVLIAELRRTQSEVARLAAADAVAHERLRFARDLHDLLGHSLSLIVLKAELARRLLERGDQGERVRAEVAELEEAARRALVEVREAVAGYRARSFAVELERGRDALAAAGVELTVTGIPEQATQAASAGAAASAGHPASAPPTVFPPAVDELLAWVVREATTNIVRHSLAANASIRIELDETVVRLEVTDDGPGSTEWDWLAAARSGSSGLLGLEERVAAAGGRFTAGPADGGGFCVRAVVPLADALGGDQTETQAVAS